MDKVCRAFGPTTLSLVSASVPLRTKTAVHTGIQLFVVHDDLLRTEQPGLQLELDWRKAELTIRRQIYDNLCVTFYKIQKE